MNANERKYEISISKLRDYLSLIPCYSAQNGERDLHVHRPACALLPDDYQDMGREETGQRKPGEPATDRPQLHPGLLHGDAEPETQGPGRFQQQAIALP